MTVTLLLDKYEAIEVPENFGAYSKVEVHPLDSKGGLTELDTLFEDEVEAAFWLGSQHEDDDRGWVMLLKPIDKFKEEGEEAYESALSDAKECELVEYDGPIDGSRRMRYQASCNLCVLPVQLQLTDINGKTIQGVAQLVLDLVAATNLDVSDGRTAPLEISIWDKGFTLAKRLAKSLEGKGSIDRPSFDDRCALWLIDDYGYSREAEYNCYSTSLSHSSCLHRPDMPARLQCESGCSYNAHSRSMILSAIYPLNSAQIGHLRAVEGADEETFGTAWQDFCSSLQSDS